MRRSIGMLIGGIALMLTASLFAQEEVQETREMQSRPTEERRFELWLRGQGFLFENFFQATEESAQEDVKALYAEVGASVLVSRSVPVKAYLSASTIQYDDDVLDSSEGFRIGLQGDMRPHAFDVNFDRQMDRPTFDVGDVFDRADVSTISGEYGHRITPNWEVKVDGELQEQEFDLTPDRDNSYGELGGGIRYRGWRQFSPEIGFASGERDVDDERLSYEQDEVYLQVRSALTPRLYASARLRLRDRSYITDDVTSSNFGRSDDRHQISGYADYRLLNYLTLNLYGSYEDVDSNLEGRDFDTSMLLAGLTLHY